MRSSYNEAKQHADSFRAKRRILSGEFSKVVDKVVKEILPKMLSPSLCAKCLDGCEMERKHMKGRPYCDKCGKPWEGVSRAPEGCLLVTKGEGEA